MYIPLHVHDEDASVGDSILNIGDYIDKALEYNLPAIAVTNHGSLSSMYKFYDMCSKNNLKAIIGNEFYVTQDMAQDLEAYIKMSAKDRKKSDYKPGHYSHLIIIAKNQIGLKNLLYLTSYSATKCFYMKPLLPEEVLFEHSEGLICLTACVGGVIPQMILNDCDDAIIKQKILKYKSIFQRDFYLELQPCQFTEQIQVNINLLK